MVWMILLIPFFGGMIPGYLDPCWCVDVAEVRSCQFRITEDIFSKWLAVDLDHQLIGFSLKGDRWLFRRPEETLPSQERRAP